MAIDVPRFPYTFVLRHLDADHDTIARDLGYRDYAEYLRRAVRLEEPLTAFASPGTVPRGRKATLEFERDGEDIATIGMHFAHRDGSELVDFTDDDSVALEARFATLWTAILAYFPPTIALSAIVWHDWGVDISAPNPAVRTTVIGSPTPGGNDSDVPLPAQVAMSVTFKTTVRRNWGRVYLPAMTDSALDAGRYEVGHVNAVRTAFGNLLDGAADDSTPLVVWSPRKLGNLLKFDKESKLAHLDRPDDTSFARTVDVVQVDDVPDVIRSRRVDKAIVKATHTLA